MKHLVFVERFIISGQKAVDKRGICLRARALISLRSLNQGRRVSKVDGRSPRERFERINVPGGAGADSLVVVCRVTRVNQQRHARNRTSSSPSGPRPSPWRSLGRAVSVNCETSFIESTTHDPRRGWPTLRS